MKKIFVFVASVFLIINFSACKFFAPKDDKDFAIADTSAVQKIFITDKGKHQITLTRNNGNYWIVNGKYIARKDAIDLLLQGMHDIRVNRPVSLAEHNNVVKEMSNDAIKVEIFTSKNSPEKTYYVGSPGPNYQGNYFLMEGSKQPYIVEIPGFDGEERVRYILEERDWRSRNLMHLLPSEIRKVSVQYFDDRKNESFVIEAKNLNEFILEPAAQPDEKKCFAFFNEFRKLNALAFALDVADVNAFKTTSPFAIIEVETTTADKKTLELIHVPFGRRSKKRVDDLGHPMSFDSENYYAWANNHTDFVLIQDFTLRNILKLRKDFTK